MRFRYLNIVLICGVVFSVASVYTLKYRAQLIAKGNAKLSQQIAQEKVVMSALDAKWALVNQPHIVEAIVTRNSEIMKLVPVEAEQFAFLDDIPMRPSTPDAQMLTDLLDALEGEAVRVDIGLIGKLIEDSVQ